MTDKTASILEQRKTSHGEYLEHADIAQGILDECMRGRNWAILPRAMRESLHMFAHKMARVVTGNPYHEDHWDDISGYAVLISQRMGKLRPAAGPAQAALPLSGAEPAPERSELSPAADIGAAGTTGAAGGAEGSQGLAKGDRVNDRLPPGYAEKLAAVPHPSPVLELEHQRQPRDATNAEYQAFKNLSIPAGRMKDVPWSYIYELTAADDGRWKMFPVYHEEYGS